MRSGTETASNTNDFHLGCVTNAAQYPHIVTDAIVLVVCWQNNRRIVLNLIKADASRLANDFPTGTNIDCSPRFGFNETFGEMSKIKFHYLVRPSLQLFPPSPSVTSSTPENQLVERF